MFLRDTLLFVLIFGSLPFIIKRPYLGVLVWSWLAYMNPHRLSWGAAFDFPFSQVVAVVTIASLVGARAWRSISWSPLIVLWLTFFLWTALTTVFAMTEYAGLGWSRWWKVQLFSLVTLTLMQSRERIHALVWVIALSLGFYGVKGGIFGIVTGGKYHVLGPPGSFFAGNTEVGIVLIMVIPLLGYLRLEFESKLARLATAGAMALTAVAILVTQSRGALVGFIAMGSFLIIKSANRLRLGLVALVLGVAILSSLPQTWYDKMQTIEAYGDDSSALGRINAWGFAFNLAVERPILGGGFNTFTRPLFKKYAPNPNDFHDAHSIYFEVLAEQGFIGLTLFLGLGLLAYRMGSRIIRNSRDRPDLQWAKNLAAMIQVSLVGYATCGAFLGLAYFDLYYTLIALLVLTWQQVKEALNSPLPPTPSAGATN